MRLTGEILENKGRIEICSNRAWGSVCYGTGFTSTDGHVLCRQIGFSNLKGWQCLSDCLDSYHCIYKAYIMRIMNILIMYHTTYNYINIDGSQC